MDSAQNLKEQIVDRLGDYGHVVADPQDGEDSIACVSCFTEGSQNVTVFVAEVIAESDGVLIADANGQTYPLDSVKLASDLNALLKQVIYRT